MLPLFQVVLFIVFRNIRLGNLQLLMIYLIVNIIKDTAKPIITTNIEGSVL